MEFSEQLRHEKRSLLIRANGGISLPAAGCIYWLIIGIGGIFLKPQLWFPIACFGTGVIFPLGLLLSKPLKANLNVKSSLTDLFLPALISMFMFWPLAIIASMKDPAFAPLALAVGMGIHWPVIGWMYNSRIFLLHALVRTVGSTSLWLLFPDHRFTLVPFFVSLVYLITIFGIRRDIMKAKDEELMTI
jgi:hypothetical protein